MEVFITLRCIELMILFMALEVRLSMNMISLSANQYDQLHVLPMIVDMKIYILNK